MVHAVALFMLLNLFARRPLGAAKRSPLARNNSAHAVLGDVRVHSVADHNRVAVGALGRMSATVSIVVLLQTGHHDILAAVLAYSVYVQATFLCMGVDARNTQVALRGWAMNQRVLAVSFVVHGEQLARADVVAAPVGAFDAEPVELVKQHARVAQVAGCVERLTVDGANGLDLEGAVKAGGAEGMTAWLGGQGMMKGGATDRAFEALVDLGFVLEVLVIDWKEACSVRA